eukprot:229864_1
MKEEEEDDGIFYMELLDIIHCILYHSDVLMRLRSHKRKCVDGKQDEKQEEEFKYSNDHDDLNDVEINKFSIHINTKNMLVLTREIVMDETLKKIPKTEMNQLVKWLEYEEFDSDAIQDDIDTT